MNIVRTLRKRFVRNPASASQITVAFNQHLGRLPTRREIATWERKWLSPKQMDRRIKRLTKGTFVSRVVKGRFLGADSASEFVMPPPVDKLSDEEYVKTLYEHILGYYPTPPELHDAALMLRSDGFSRHDLMAQYFAGRVKEEMAWEKAGSVNDVNRFSIMGTDSSMTVKEWRAKARAGGAPMIHHSRFPLRPRSSEVDVSVICSVWRGGDFIEKYLENITSQSIFTDRCELIVVDAASPEGEGEVVARYAERFGHRIVYHRLPYRAGIYVAWNVGVGLARGQYLTNANLDDLRREDSLELQATTLDALPDVDVVYQEYYYSADPDADFATIAGAGAVSDLPIVTRDGFLNFNQPHNAPMWRSSLHDRIGMFDERLRSAGDYDFWIRAITEGARFYKINDPHVAYYYNPDGISTSRQTTGVLEKRDVKRRHGRALVPEAAMEPPDKFLRRLGFDRWPERSDGIPFSRYEAVQSRMRLTAAAHRAHQSGALK